jgi:hypothetical protein
MGPTSHFLATSDWANMGLSRPFGGWLETRGNAVHWSLRADRGPSSRCFCHAIMTAISSLLGQKDRRKPSGPLGTGGPAGGTRHRLCIRVSGGFVWTLPELG